jgi:hypothetical protein
LAEPKCSKSNSPTAKNGNRAAWSVACPALGVGMSRRVGSATKDVAMEKNADDSPLPRPTPLFSLPSILIFLALWLILLIVGRSKMFQDPGTFWHVAAGARMITTGEVIREDPFSFTRVQEPWVADQWLAECTMAAVHRVAGWDGLLLLTATLLATAYAWIAARLLRAGLHILPAMLLIALAMMVGSPQFHVRPLIVSIVLTAVTFGWLIDVEAGRRSFRWLWWLAPIFLLWANMHGGMLGGVGTVALCLAGWCVLALLNRRTASRIAGGQRPTENAEPRNCPSVIAQVLASAALLIALAATMFISPYGLAMPREWLETLAMPLPDFISEHARLSLTEPLGLATLALGVVYLATLIGVFPQRPRITWLVPLVWLVLAILRSRNAPLFGVTAVLALADMLPHSRLGRWLETRDLLRNLPSPFGRGAGGEGCARTKLSRYIRLLPIAAIALAVLLQVTSIRVPVIGRDWVRFDPDQWPVELLPKLETINESSEDSTPIFNDLNFGGFLIYHTPRLRVFVDDRCPLYGTKFLLEYDRARCKDPAQIDRWRQQYGFRYALVRAADRFDQYMAKSNDWKLVQRSTAAALYQSR